ncbi:PTS sugar transporter subunit IIA [[Mycoplasma] testudinis]|uniref:PTS sugar transporter subunit IIA n=1 Tax=[Mycoplasma] testudinis TaxID=33924 RepID=UPI00069790B7|nr:hypothetical protein [[Mycoplasma] testudinis]
MSYKIIIAGHAEYPSGIKSFLELVSGVEAPIITHNINETILIDQFEKNLTQTLSDGQDAVIICDLAGGAPHQTSVKVVNQNQRKNVVVVAGLNMALIMDLVLKVTIIGVESTSELANYLKEKVQGMGSTAHIFAN